jgi:elongator complex protein 3
MIRWLQVYGRAIAIGGGSKERSSQHVGFGRKLMIKAEEIARAKGAVKLCDISGIGVRQYYRKLGYVLDGTYMVKQLH